MNRYTISPHIADVRLNVSATSLKQLFVYALEGMNRILSKHYEAHLEKKAVTKKIRITSSDTTLLLIDFLSEVLTLSHVHKAIFHTVSRLDLKNSTLRATLLGANVSQFDEDIKAVTYHEAQVKQDPKGGYKTTIVFDI